MCATGSWRAGVTSILNFAPVVLSVPSGVDVRKVDLSIELQILAFHAQRRAIVGVAAPRRERVARTGRPGGAATTARPPPRRPTGRGDSSTGGRHRDGAQAVGT